MNDFDKGFKRFERMAVVAWAFGACLTCATLGGIAFVAYRLLVHFGVL